MKAEVDYSPATWIEKAKQKIKDHGDTIEEVEFMVSTDYSRNRWRAEHAEKSIEFLEAGIRFAESQL